MKWLIQPVKIESKQIDLLMYMLAQAEIEYDIVYPFQGMVLNADKTPYKYDTKETYFVCGSYSLTRNVYKDRKESVFSLENYSFDDFINIFGIKNFVNHDAKIIHSKDIVWEKDEYFIRPLKDDKAFNGGIYNKKTFKYEGDIVLADLKHISKEYRFFIIDNQIVTSSLYKIDGELSTSSVIDRDVQDFAQEMIKLFNFPGFVIDIAKVDNSCKIMELNCLNASGFYDINLYKLINSVTDYYEKINPNNLNKFKKK